ncbi:hypothetical protein E2C01_062575 [Portunus trituberculatus]|uniref:Uncharacterized protein n=1 Tax=Portunus trituberculatus TaxID=210409 RepID=A0A5B7HFP1_PORTR|nr:hypothetical protein [Portunus trituberculatus]
MAPRPAKAAHLQGSTIPPQKSRMGQVTAAFYRRKEQMYVSAYSDKGNKRLDRLLLFTNNCRKVGHCKEDTLNSLPLVNTISTNKKRTSVFVFEFNKSRL